MEWRLGLGDDIILIGSNNIFLSQFISHISFEFSIKDHGPLHYFNIIEVSLSEMSIFLSQEKYSRDLLTRACSSKCKFSHLSGPFLEPSENCSLVRVPQYLTIIKIDLVYSMNTFCQHMHAPLVGHMQQIKRILHYVQGTLTRASYTPRLHT